MFEFIIMPLFFILNLRGIYISCLELFYFKESHNYKKTYKIIYRYIRMHLVNEDCINFLNLLKMFKALLMLKRATDKLYLGIIGDIFFRLSIFFMTFSYYINKFSLFPSFPISLVFTSLAFTFLITSSIFSFLNHNFYVNNFYEKIV